ncbi:MAG: quinoprotein dehydrogenase-associated SoxYZ-like carrier [Alphaproteobacteria bacterium]
MGWPRMRNNSSIVGLAMAMMVLLALSAGQAMAADDAWPDIRAALFDDRDIRDGAGVIRLQAPERAEDAAIVPIKVTADMPQTVDRYIRTIHLVIDQNPAPVAGVFHLTPESGVATIATRVRVNEYTHVRAVAETNDGALYMATAFVKASGGCSAPALKDHEVAMSRMGKMKVKEITPFTPGEPNQVQLMISHPNYSGLQIDQVTRNWVPPHFVESIDVRYGGKTIMTVEGDISLSENPSVRFSFVPDRPGALEIRAVDTEGAVFEMTQPVGPTPGA